MNGSGKKLMRAASVSRLAVAATVSLGLAITMPASATASPDHAKATHATPGPTRGGPGLAWGAGLAHAGPGAAAGAAAARGRAAVPKTTRPREFSVLNAVSCASQASCVSGGYSLGPRSYVQLAAQWDGTAWAQLPTPTGPALVPGLTAVSCASGSMCMAVDGGGLQEWNGATWQAQSAGLDSGVSAVSCASTVSCVVIGGRTAFVQGQFTVLPAAAHWNGQTWTEVDPVVPPGAAVSSLDAISCVSASDCVAVGSDSANLAGNGAPIAEQWNGQSWSLLSVPAPSGAVLETNLASVSCTGPDSCVAVGDVDINVNGVGDDQGLAYAWDGTSWTALPQPIGIPASVSCWSASGCATTDQVGFGAGGTAIPELWNGSSWAQLQPPLPSTQFAGFNGVSCYGPSACMFVGSVGGSRPLAELWTGGQWLTDRVIPRAGFAGVWCMGIDDCTAIGGYIDDADENATLTANFSGLGWQQATTPAVSGTLTDISCDSPRFCVAVGGHGQKDLPLAEKWDGTSWQVLDTSFGDNVSGTQPFAVSCAGGRCLAITSNTYPSHYAEWWNGSSWRLIKNVPTPRPHGFAQLSDVSCASASYCLVAGTFHNRKGPFTSFADLWNGKGFRLLRVPGNGLTSISCLSTRFCLGVTVNSAVTWNGSSWRVRHLPGFFGRPGLSAVSCASERLCMAVGNFVAEEGRGNTVALLTGTTWRILPALPASDVVLTDVSCTSRSGQCFVVGESYDGASATQTFTAAWTGRDWLVYPAPNP